MNNFIIKIMNYHEFPKLFDMIFGNNFQKIIFLNFNMILKESNK